MPNKKADALGLTTLLVTVIAVGIILGWVMEATQPLRRFFNPEPPVWSPLGLLEPLLYVGAIMLVAAWFAVIAVLEGQRSLKAELEQQRAEVAALRLEIKDRPSAPPEHDALPDQGEPEIEYR
ncbi:hypothetical protein ATK74_2664 [Propionicimonas paludicola]|uniref:Uncharacterized protein n=1 Tax=Propionicimonas paludicola TaxID=185243 RepID=A0A2A9CUI7_9ACTN|nr:hypothetical protein [Propionicimonas paludicola]PFG18084.1 hypothetical protein ATK74_2664 [Propionicimonas paludicola]